MFDNVWCQFVSICIAWCQYESIFDVNLLPNGWRWMFSLLWHCVSWLLCTSAANFTAETHWSQTDITFSTKCFRIQNGGSVHRWQKFQIQQRVWQIAPIFRCYCHGRRLRFKKKLRKTFAIFFSQRIQISNPGKFEKVRNQWSHTKIEYELIQK